MKILPELDHIILGLPVAAFSALGAASGFLEQNRFAPVRVVGWLGCRTAIVLGVFSGLPLLIYSIAKTAFAKTLNAATFNRFECLKAFEKHAELQLNVSFITVSALPVIILALPHAIRIAYKTYDTYKQLQAVKDELEKSELWKNLQELYKNMQNVLNPEEQEVVLVEAVAVAVAQELEVVLEVAREVPEAKKIVEEVKEEIKKEEAALKKLLDF